MALIGPTASGKTALGLELARCAEGVEIVSVDSMAVYRGMDIGTAKPTVAERAEIPVHMVDLVDPSFDFTVRHYQSGAAEVLTDIERRSNRALFVGGTGLYLRSITDGLELPGVWPEIAAGLETDADVRGPEMLHARLEKLDPVAASRIEPTNRRRVVRALEVTVGSGKPFSSYGPGLRAYPVSNVTQVGIPYVGSIHDERDRETLRQAARGRTGRRGAGARRRARGDVAHGSAGDRLPGASGAYRRRSPARRGDRIGDPPHEGAGAASMVVVRSAIHASGGSIPLAIWSARCSSSGTLWARP